MVAMVWSAMESFGVVGFSSWQSSAFLHNQGRLPPSAPGKKLP